MALVIYYLRGISYFIEPIIFLNTVFLRLVVIYQRVQVSIITETFNTYSFYSLYYPLLHKICSNTSLIPDILIVILIFNTFFILIIFITLLKLKIFSGTCYCFFAILAFCTNPFSGQTSPAKNSYLSTFSGDKFKS